jgi:hypothetical protein
VGPDPNPQESVAHFDRDGAISGFRDLYRIRVANFPEPQRRSSAGYLAKPDRFAASPFLPLPVIPDRAAKLICPDDFIHRSGSTAIGFLARSRDHLIEPACLNVFFELLVPQRVEMIAQFFCQLPCLGRQSLDRVSNFGDRAHRLRLRHGTQRYE